MIKELFKHNEEIVINSISLRDKHRLSLRVMRCNLFNNREGFTIKFVVNNEPMKVWFKAEMIDISSSNYETDFVTYFIKSNTSLSGQVYGFISDIEEQRKEKAILALKPKPYRNNYNTLKEGIIPISMQKDNQ